MKNPRVVLVTGASSGIGKATAACLAQEGLRVFGAARSAPHAHNDSFTFFPVDVRDDRSVQGCVSQVLARSGRIDVLVNCAGVVVGGPAEEMLADEITDQIQTNLLGTMRTCRAVLTGNERAGIRAHRQRRLPGRADGRSIPVRVQRKQVWDRRLL